MMHKGFEATNKKQAMAQIIEEMGESIAAYGKMQRFGEQSVNPLLPKEEQETNIDWFEREVLDTWKAIEQYWNL